MHLLIYTCVHLVSAFALLKCVSCVRFCWYCFLLVFVVFYLCDRITVNETGNWISCCCVAVTLYCDIYKLTFVVVVISSCCNQFFCLFTEVIQPLFRRQVRYVTAFSFPALNAPFSSPAINTPPQENFKWSKYYILSCRIPIKYNQFYISLAPGTLQCCPSQDSAP